MQPEGLTLELTRVIAAPRERVFACFEDPALLSRWWGPAGFSIPSIDFAPRAGATYRIEMQPPEGDAFQLVGTFHEVEAASRLAFSFQWLPPDPDDVETLAQLSFEATGDATEVRLVQGPFRTRARCELHRDGWTQSFERLARLLAGQA